jgi:hypothetical protein
MAEELTRYAKHPDNVTGYVDTVEGEDQPQSSLIQGTLIKFTNEATWVTRDGTELSPHLKLVFIDVVRVVQRWKDKTPVETVIVEPGRPWPDVDAMNDRVPRSEWVTGPSGPRGPWQAQRLVYLLDLRTMDKFTYATGTTGGRIAIAEVVEKMQNMRRYHREENIFPIVTLSDVHMKTNYGGRQRPHFIVVDWIKLGDNGPSALPAPEVKAIDTTKPVGEPVKPPSAREEMNDEIPF